VWENGNGIIKMDIKVIQICNHPGLPKIPLETVKIIPFIYKSLLNLKLLEIMTEYGFLPLEVLTQVSSGKSPTSKSLPW